MGRPGRLPQFAVFSASLPAPPASPSAQEPFIPAGTCPDCLPPWPLSFLSRALTGVPSSCVAWCQQPRVPESHLGPHTSSPLSPSVTAPTSSNALAYLPSSSRPKRPARWHSVPARPLRGPHTAMAPTGVSACRRQKWAPHSEGAAAVQPQVALAPGL